MILLVLLLLVVLLLLFCGGYVFISACVRKKELPWMVKEELEKTPYGKYYECIIDADRWLKDHHAQSHYITSRDGLRLHGLWIPAENAKGTMLLVHGYRSTKLVDFGVAFAYYHERGYNVLVPDHRCHGKSEGCYITFGVKESRDMEEWIAYHNRCFGPFPLVLSGLSMGASTVLYMADQALADNVKGIIADCGFTSPADIISKVFKDVVHFSPGPFLRVADLFARLFAGFSLYEKSTVRCLANSVRPVLLIHGLMDDYVPCEMTRVAYDSCTGKKTLLLVEGAGHGVSFLVDHERYSETVEAFLEECMEEEP